MRIKSKSMLNIAILVLALASAILAFYIWYAHITFEEGITVSADGVTEAVVEVRDLSLVPAQSKEYTINLICKATGGYHISLIYEEKIDGGMKQFVNVTVKLGDREVYRGSLSGLLNGEEVIQFDGELEEKEPLPVTVIYEMPTSIGNEAQGTYADFDVRVEILKS